MTLIHDKSKQIFRNNNNNNMYESMNMNTNSRRKKSFEGNNSMDNVAKMFREENVSPWDKRVFLEIMNEDSGLGVMERWLTSVVVNYPTCAVTIPCLAASEWWGTSHDICPDKKKCPLFED